MTPGLFGVVGKLSPTGSSSYVDTHDSSGPLVLLIGSPGSQASDWAAIQVLLERNGMGSVVVVPTGRAWEAPIRAAADSLLDHLVQQRRSLVSLTFGTAMDSLLLAAPLGHALRSGRLTAIAPGRPRLTGIGRWIARLREQIGLAPDRADLRLAAWAAPVMVLRAQDDNRFDAKDAERLAAGTGQARVGVLPGGGFASAPQHPADDTWRDVIEFVLGRARYHDAVVHPDSVMVRDTLLALPATTSPRATPTVERPR
ncbi:MAG: hypothetical protein ABIR59_05820 [Gemmatimonadales bacterium]